MKSTNIVPETHYDVELDLTFEVKWDYYNSYKDLEAMLAASVTAWERATSHNCNKMTYYIDVDSSVSCDERGPYKRDGLSWTLEKREPTL